MTEPEAKRTSRLKELDEEYTVWRALMQDISDYILPRRGLFERDGKPNTRVQRHDRIIDSTATRAVRITGAGLQGGLTSPSRPWFRLGHPDPDLAKFGPVKEWLSASERILYQILHKSNFYTAVHTMYEEEAGFGTGVLYEEDDDRSTVRFRLFTAGEYRIDNGPDGMVDTVYRPFWMNAKQLAMQFGLDVLPDIVRRTLDQNPFEWFKVIHAIEPNPDANPDMADVFAQPFTGAWFLEGREMEGGRPAYLRETGYYEFPGAAPRWSTVGSVPYGFGPGHDALPDVKMLQEMERAVLKAIHKEIDPPMAIPAKFKGILSLVPGANNYVEAGDREGVRPIYQIALNVQNVELKSEALRSRIAQGFYNDLFLMLASSSKEMTATEVAERHEEKLLMLGPTIERQIHECLDPIINRTLGIAYRRGLLPPVPAELQGGEPLDVEYISILAQAQKLVEAQAINAHMTMVERVANLSPESAQAATNFTEMLATHADTVGLPPRIARSAEQAAQILAQIQQAQQRERQIAEAQAGVDMVKGLGQTSTASGTALGDLKKALEQ